MLACSRAFAFFFFFWLYCAGTAHQHDFANTLSLPGLLAMVDGRTALPTFPAALSSELPAVCSHIILRFPSQARPTSVRTLAEAMLALKLILISKQTYGEGDGHIWNPCYQYPCFAFAVFILISCFAL